MKQKRIVLVILILFVFLLAGGVALYMSRPSEQTGAEKKEPKKIETRESDIEVSDYQVYEYDDETIHTDDSKAFQKIQSSSGSTTTGTDSNQKQDTEDSSNGQQPENSTEQGTSEGLIEDESKNTGTVIDVKEWR